MRDCRTPEDLLRSRAEDVREIAGIQENKLQGRWRYDRAFPSSAADVISGDALGDRMTNGTYLVELVDEDMSGSLKWHRTTLSVGW